MLRWTTHRTGAGCYALFFIKHPTVFLLGTLGERLRVPVDVDFEHLPTQLAFGPPSPAGEYTVVALGKSKRQQQDTIFVRYSVGVDGDVTRMEEPVTLLQPDLGLNDFAQRVLWFEYSPGAQDELAMTVKTSWSSGGDRRSTFETLVFADAALHGVAPPKPARRYRGWNGKAWAPAGDCILAAPYFDSRKATKAQTLMLSRLYFLGQRSDSGFEDASHESMDESLFLHPSVDLGIFPLLVKFRRGHEHERLLVAIAGTPTPGDTEETLVCVLEIDPGGAYPVVCKLGKGQLARVHTTGDMCDWPMDIGWSGTGSLLAVCGLARTLKTVDVVTGIIAQDINVPEDIFTCSFGPTGSVLSAMGAQALVRQFNLDSFGVVFRYQASGACLGGHVHRAPDGSHPHRAHGGKGAQHVPGWVGLL